MSGATALGDQVAVSGHQVLQPSVELWQPQASPFATVHSGLEVFWTDGVPDVTVAGTTMALHHAVKRGLDITLALLAILLLLPLFMVVAVSIKLTSPGPVLFRQVREGRHGVPFMAYKFRSMRVDRGDQTGRAQTTKNDPRVTAVGHFLRRTSIDELPQLFNVLFGEMSLVGPRPHVPGMLAGGVSYRELVPYYDERLRVKPGITGWAQANGLRGPTTDAVVAKARIDHDLAYVQNFSVWLDIRILCRTVVREFLTGSGH